ncbi:non-canonical purine NTP pyrophosphatase, partial [candidate division WOR-3 bacterium]|nr:non-canonical purine NTP pyrophosphatase [candidate division WOR-3 bacterium]
GAHGFGYDPIFYVPELGKTLAELPLEAKNRISHRARAINKLKPYLLELMNSS